MTVWRSLGASVIGPAHIAAGKPNQDAWAAFHRVWGDGVVVSDGLGSKPFSDLGSRFACRAVFYAVNACRETEINHFGFVLSEHIKREWLSLIAPLAPRECAATCLFALRLNDGVIRMGMLGDGLGAAVKADGSVATLAEDKSEGFSNITVALSAHTAEKDWRWLSMPEEDCRSIVLCTDGVADDLSDESGFVKGFCNSYRGLSSIAASRRAHEMLENWPVPRHSDDKTIACLFREEAADESD